jgi:hypothetical protein
VAGVASFMSERSLREFRRAIYGLPWGRLPRPVLVVLTYPGEWREYCQDDRELRRHLEALFDRWARRWGEEPVCLWGKEFQGRGAPHVNLVVGLPAGVSDADYAGLRRRSGRLFTEYQAFGKGGSGKRWEPVEGEFGWWLRTAWAEIVTGNVKGDGAARRHHVHGVTVRVRFDAERGAGVEHALRMALYVARDLGKEGQKVAPVEFGPVRRWWGYRGKGFAPREECWWVPEEVAVRVRKRVVRCVALGLLRERGPDAARQYRERVGRYGAQGAWTWRLGEEEGMRLLLWSVRAVGRKCGRDVVVVNADGELLAV